MTTKPVVLLNWGYHRKGWIEVFEAIKDSFDFHYLYWIAPGMEPANHTSSPVHYWSDFTSARQVIDRIKPEKVVMMGTDSVVTMALLFECRRRKIPTYVLQHGLFHDYKTNIYLDEQMAKNRVGQPSVRVVHDKSVFSTMKFFARSFRLRQLAYIPKIAKWVRDKKKMLHLKAWMQNQAPYRWADKYIVYTKYNGRFFSEIEGIGEDRMIEIGSPEFDSFYAYAQANGVQARGSYNLLIDSALTAIPEYLTNGVVSQESYNNFIADLNTLSLEQGKKLYVKLHPFCYKNPGFYQHENITYLHDCDVVELLMQASMIFGFDSTLIIPSLYFKPTVLFKLNDFAYLPRIIQEIHAAPVLDYFHYDRNELRTVAGSNISEEARHELVKRFLFVADARAKERLRDVLLA